VRGRSLFTVLFAYLAVSTQPLLAASLEQLVMPGPVIEGHAEFETECGKCHASFARGAQDGLCLDCHDAVAADVTNKKGFHGKQLSAHPQLCQNCHAEHQGRAADVVTLNVELFDHAVTDFPLDGGHIGQPCISCHEADVLPRDASSRCIDCHEDDQPHRGRLGDDCAGCHSTAGWTNVEFDHSSTDFALTGAHRDTTCMQCHVGQTWENLASKCVSCHAVDDQHRGTRGKDCGNCHVTSSWKVESFDHFAKTGFRLRGAHASIACEACHLQDMARPKPPDSCIGCHSFDDVHGGRHGRDCVKCHSVDDWKTTRFDHLAETGFELKGAHVDLTCAVCHVGALEDPLEKTCDTCHAEDDAHDGTQPHCERCHDERSWHDVRFNHDFTSFPLIGQHRTAACEDCHSGTVFNDVPEACLDCHTGDDYHHGKFGAACADCHNPNGWNRWVFDHDTQTGFPLTGAHRKLECDACHTPDSVEPGELQTLCIACHRKDDAHEGRFGGDCGRCHTTESFDTAVTLP